MATSKATVPPESPKIYHVTHLDNLGSLSSCGCLYSDSQMVRRGVGKTVIGMSEIKRRRLEELDVSCHPGTKVGEYVPFYFCPRSIMLYLLYRANAPGLAYAGRQRPIVHLESDLNETVEWAERAGRRWAFSTSNAGAYYAEFHKSLKKLPLIDWDAVRNNDFSVPKIKEGKQAEFLVYETFPWQLIRRIGVIGAGEAAQVQMNLARAAHTPQITVEPEWYF
ncbi:MAG TPA: DUF4433 domain-containing protein [Chthonomonadaceae bacterium]|nr:DUF4433 domain-containing protein [Chthonomonadaceae bacterium]